MNRDVLEGRWRQVRGEVKQRWGKLTDDELDQIAGSSQKLIGLLQEHYGIARDEAARRVSELISSTDDSPAGAGDPAEVEQEAPVR
jgi:uncharacterized protein YjbJ (UPF0337 family)